MKKVIITSLGFFAPLLAFAQNTTYINNVIDIIESIISSAFPILSSIAVLYFFYELIQYIRSSPEEKAENRSGLLYAILALFILFSVWGIIGIIQTVTNTDGSQTIQTSDIPQINF